MSMTPFEVRLEVLKMAKELIMDNYYAQRDKVNQQYETLRCFNMDNKLSAPDYPELPKAPTEDEIITKAKALNDFVSDTGKK